MSNRVKCWNLYQHAKTWVVRPSELLSISNDYVAYCLDEAVFTFGTWVESELDSIEGEKAQDVNRKRRDRLYSILQMPDHVRFKSFKRPGAKQKLPKKTG